MKVSVIIQLVLSVFLFNLLVPADPYIKSINPEREQDLLAWILLCEDQRDEKPLLELLSLEKKISAEILVRLAHASGRIPSFGMWELLSKMPYHDQRLTDALAIAARYPENKFPGDRVFRILKDRPLSNHIVETFLFLNNPEAFEYALTLKEFPKTVARNLWRSKDFINFKILKKYYQQVPEATVYSIYRSRTTGIIHASDIKDMQLENRYYGCLVCDHPEKYLGDSAWLVRIAAVKTARSPESAKKLLSDPVPLVRAAALEVYLSCGGDPSAVPMDTLNVMEAGILLPRLKDRVKVKKIFDRRGWFSEISAPYMDRSKRDEILSSNLSDRAKILFTENQIGVKSAISLAQKLFQEKNSRFALHYLLSQKEGVNPQEIIEAAKKKGGFLSELQDLGFIKPRPVARPLQFYKALLNEIQGFQGFKIITSKGTIRCQFFLQEAPMTCFNFIKLAGSNYFSNLIFHRVVPAFVSQDGDPTGTGSGGPGYSIRCEPNALKYNRPGMVGMALSGKDTGGSQYFITHLATPHLNHQYTIFGKVISGMNILSLLCQYDEIENILLY